MYAPDSERGRLRGQSSWGGDWNTYGNNTDYGRGNNPDYGRGSNPDYGRGNNPDYGRGNNSDYGHGNNSEYGRNQSIDDRNEYSNQGFGRSQEQQDDASSSKIVCQNYLQNKCMRGSSCLFRHPPSSGSTPRQSSSSLSKKQQNAWLNFCSSFQKGQCPFTDDCRLLHVSKRDEAEYRNSGDIPTGVVEQAMSKAMVMDWAYIGNQPHCKDYLQGSCTMRGCNFRHLNTDQYVVEVLAALREKFMMSPSEMFQDKAWGSSFSSGNKEVDQYGSRPSPSHSRNNYGSTDNFESDPKRIRSQEPKYPLDDRRQSRQDDYVKPPISQGNDSYSQRPVAVDEDFLDTLRRDNIEMTKTNEDVKATAQKLEDENAELRKALRLALDLNSHARTLQEFRNHLRDIQASLKKRGYNRDSYSTAGSGSWNSRQAEPLPTTSGMPDNRMYGERISAGIGSTGSRYLMEYDRADMQHSQPSHFKSPW